MATTTHNVDLDAAREELARREQADYDAKVEKLAKENRERKLAEADRQEKAAKAREEQTQRLGDIHAVLANMREWGDYAAAGRPDVDLAKSLADRVHQLAPDLVEGHRYFSEQVCWQRYRAGLPEAVPNEHSFAQFQALVQRLAESLEKELEQ